MKKLLFLVVAVGSLFAASCGKKASLSEQYADKVCSCTNPKLKEIKDFASQPPANGDTLTASKKAFKMIEEMAACTAELDKQVAALKPDEKTKFEQEVKAITDKKCPIAEN